MFGKRLHPDDPANFRSSQRVDPRGMIAVIDGVHAELLDYSDGGIRVLLNGQTKRTVLIEIYRGDRLFRKCAAVIAWERADQTGYAFRPNLRLYEVQPVEKRQEHIQDEVAEEKPESGLNKSGGVSGSALRKRLNL